MQTIEPGDWLIYRKSKRSDHPGPRAKGVTPTPHGEDYGYTVDKFWVAVDTTEDGHVRIHTRRGKEYTIQMSDPNLRRARWWERILYRRRFKHVEETLLVS